ncbi:PQQ-binding-like beta-propeller repeat protein [Rubritalea marina]|uniref:PQQ-binding-like beta-propeller repeat protein n=1 Tax=Rubritalea marina TaxID=361055 RepID=UPI00035E7AA3|nr:PQQ-binding-like beta-propeller repeat protein [Rubritalea marina]
MMKQLELHSNCTDLYLLDGRLIKNLNGIFFLDSHTVDGLSSRYDLHSFDSAPHYTQNSTLFHFPANALAPEVVLQLTGEVSIYRFSDDLFLCHERLSRKELKYTLVDKTGTVYWKQVADKTVRHIANKLLVRNRLSNRNGEFWLHDQHGKELFHHQLPEGFTFREVDVIDDVLFLESWKGGNEVMRLTGLNANTGELLWKREYSIPYRTNCIVSTREGKLYYGLSQKYFQILNPVTGEFVVNISVEGMFPKGVAPEVNLQSIQDGKLWFVSGRGPDACFGCFDIEARSLDFIQQHPLEGDDIFDTPIFHEGKLYLRTKFEKLLYVLE